MGYTRPQLDGATLHWVLALTIRGTVYYFSELELHITSTELGDLAMVPTLSPIEFPNESDPWTQATTERSVSVTVVFAEAAGEGWAQIASTAHDAGDATAELSLIREGDTWEQREVMLQGRADELDYGPVYEPLRFSIREEVNLDRGDLIPAPAAVNTLTWPEDATYHHDPAITGQLYPLPVGRPGRNLEGLEGQTGSPALLVKIDKSTDNNSLNDATLLLGDGILTCAGGTVTLRNHTTREEVNVTANIDQDGLGRVCTTCTVSAGTLQVAAGDAMWVSFRSSGGGIPGPRGGTLEGAGDVLRWLLGRSTLRVDTRQVLSSAHQLNAYKLDFTVNTSISPMQVVQDILDVLPASLQLGPGGLQLLYWRLDATAADVVVELDCTDGRDGDMGTISHTSSSEVANVLSINYALDRARNVHRLTRTYAPDRWPDAATGSYDPHPLCTASFTRYYETDPDRPTVRRPLVAAPLTTNLVLDGGTAAAILNAEAQKRCGTHRTTVIRNVHQRYQTLVPGAVLAISDSSRMWQSEICVLTEVIRGVGTTDLRVLAANNWIRDHK